MNTPYRKLVAAAGRIGAGLALALLVQPGWALTFSQMPLFIASTEPRVMLVMSRDHELTKKAYNDYSDITGDDVIDLSYVDSFKYYGYFDSNRCYTYTNDRFEPGDPVSGGTHANGVSRHQCSGAWSGNFLNWVTMTRLDVVRKVLYGGLRATDRDGAALGDTVLERAMIPTDTHAFVKVFAPAGGAAEVARFTPLSGAAFSFCNVTRAPFGEVSKSVTAPPLMRVASGSWGQWASSEVVQCLTDSEAHYAVTDKTSPSAATDYIVRVAVCAPGKLEANCKAYPSGAVKPIGLLQQYGDVDAERPVRFGLITGSYGLNKSGGVLRRNVSRIAGNATAAHNEINSSTGQFTGNAGIIDTLNRIRISSFRFGDRLENSTTDNAYVEQVGANAFVSGRGCADNGGASFNDGRCPDWGNPIAEMYFEALRYFAGKTTANFSSDDSAYLASALPAPAWVDPLPATEWCALSNIVVISAGPNSFDGDALTKNQDPPDKVDAVALTNRVGTLEGLAAGTSVLIGGNDGQCTAKTLGSLSEARGICPEAPNTQGSYHIAGLALANRTVDLRPGYNIQRDNRWSDINPAWAARQPMNTFTVALAESLPTFEVDTTPDAPGGVIRFLPACQACSGTTQDACQAPSEWTPCTLTDVRILQSSATQGSFLVVWEGAQWGLDYDMDAISRYDWCLGAACDSPAVASDRLRITVSLPQKVAGAQMRFGVIASGTTADGLSSFLTETRFGGYTCSDFACSGSNPGRDNHMPHTPVVLTYDVGTTAARLLRNPLWYAAKYGAPEASWDLFNNRTGASVPDGEPDQFFEVRNPAKLHEALAKIFDAASQPDAAAAAVATTTTTLQARTRVFMARFSSADWSGQVLSLPLDLLTGQLGNYEWDAGAKIKAQAPNERVVITRGASDGVAFRYDDKLLTAAQRGVLDRNRSGTLDHCGAQRVDYLRGDNTHEGIAGTFTRGSCTADTFRRRNANSDLGDIVNSNPWFVAAPSAGYSDVAHPGYAAFRTARLNRMPVVYVAANDGMLHGFNAEQTFDVNKSTWVPTANAGNAVLSYMPSAVFDNNPSWLTDRAYNQNRRYFMDGSPMVGDAHLAPTGLDPRWYSVLVGGLGAGGRGYYALDVTDPSNNAFSEANAANLLLWEFTQHDDADMGFAFNHPPTFLHNNYPKQMVRMANGRWAVILGNGYNSSAGRAVLYVLFIEAGMDGTWTAGSDYIKIVADSAGGNGLSTPVPYDMDGNGTVDVVYAGDLKGRMWKFLVGDADPANWRVDFSDANCGATSTCIPLFTATDKAGNPQPIIWPAEVTPYYDPIAGQHGATVLFGTGKYLEPGDNSSTSVQSFYAVHDQNDALIITQGSPVGGRSALGERTVTTHTTDGPDGKPNTSDDIPYRKVNGSTHSDSKGWVLDLPTSGERATGVPKLVNGLLIFNTFIPSTLPCDAGGTGWLMTLNYMQGVTPPHAVFAHLGNTLAAGVQVGAVLGGTTLLGSASGQHMFALMSRTQGDIFTIAGRTPRLFLGPDAVGRVSWRELLQ